MFEISTGTVIFHSAEVGNQQTLESENIVLKSDLLHCLVKLPGWMNFCRAHRDTGCGLAEKVRGWEMASLGAHSSSSVLSGPGTGILPALLSFGCCLGNRGQMTPQIGNMS